LTAPSLAIVSTYPPTQCGLATFTAALVDALGGGVAVVRVLDEAEPDAVAAPVVATLLNGSDASTATVVATLAAYDVVMIQHEYGIFGGADGIDILRVLDALTMPTIVVLHTVLQDPTPEQRHILEAILRMATVVVTMTHTGRRRLVDGYGCDPARVRVIPHGAIDHRRSTARHEPAEHPVLVTWGLLGPGKGIEWVIDALPALRDLNPLYRVVGRTHPKVRERHGEAYRDGLAERARRLGVADLVELDASYLTVPELARLAQQADVVLLPYDSPEQVTSGVLIEAVAAGRPVVATAFPHAVELLAGGAGLTVGRRDPDALVHALRRVLTEPGLARAMSAAAQREAPHLVWSAVADAYRALAVELAAELAGADAPTGLDDGLVRA
jgi:glycosyltransferase involved in cell wall biosynthesis